MPEPERRDPSGDAFDRAVDRHFAIYYRDSTLWPVLVVAICTALTVGSGDPRQASRSA